MNSLELWLSTQFRTERAVMNDLADAGIVSDNCSCAAEVYEEDAKKAVEWLKEKKD